MGGHRFYDFAINDFASTSIHFSDSVWSRRKARSIVWAYLYHMVFVINALRLAHQRTPQGLSPQKRAWDGQGAFSGSRRDPRSFGVKRRYGRVKPVFHFPIIFWKGFSGPTIETMALFLRNLHWTFARGFGGQRFTTCVTESE
jgi:hypothetical protein